MRRTKSLKSQVKKKKKRIKGETKTVMIVETRDQMIKKRRMTIRRSEKSQRNWKSRRVG